MPKEKETDPFFGRLQNWLEDEEIGPEKKKLLGRLQQIKTDEQAGLLNRLFDRLTGGGNE